MWLPEFHVDPSEENSSSNAWPLVVGDRFMILIRNESKSFLSASRFQVAFDPAAMSVEESSWRPVADWTNAVVASLVELSVAGVGVGAVGLPVRAGEASGAREVSVGWMWSPRDHFVDEPGAAVPSI